VQFGGSEAIITALSDEYPVIGKNREIFVACLFTLYFLVGLASCSQVTLVGDIARRSPHTEGASH
jgi:hypothetical protein